MKPDAEAPSAWPRCSGGVSTNLTFHGIGERPAGLSRGADDVWLDAPRFHAVLDALADRDDVAISFDDGNLSDLTHALPALRSRRLHATFFIVSGRIGEPGYLDEDGVRELCDGGMAIGCHGMLHRPWRRLDDAALHEELVEARRRLEEVVARPVDAASCPFGAYDRRVLSRLRRAGYRRVFTSDGGHAAPGAWLQPRTTVGRDADAVAVRSLLDRRRCGASTAGHRVKLVVKRWR